MGVRLHVKGEVMHHGHVAKFHASLLSQHLPGHDVGVMFHLGQHHGVALGEVRPTPSMGHEVDGFGGAAGDDDPLGVEALLEFGTAGLVAFGGLPSQGVDGSVNVGVGLRIVPVHRIQNDLRLLRGGCVVEVDQRVAVDLALKNRELVSKRHAITS